MSSLVLVKTLGNEDRINVIEGFPDDEIELKTLQDAVEGHVELVRYNKRFVENNIDMWVNEEGKLIGLLPSIMITKSDGELLDILVGNVFFTGHDGNGGTVPLTDEQVEIIMDELIVIGSIVILEY